MLNNNVKKKLPTILTPALKAIYNSTIVLAAFMLANSLYLLIYRLGENAGWTFFSSSPIYLSKLFQVMLLSHTGVGITLTIVMLVFVFAHFPKVLRRKHKSSIISGLIYIICGLILTVTGLFIFTKSASYNNQFAWWLHVFCGILVIFSHWLHRKVSYTRPEKTKMLKYLASTITITFLIVLGHAFEAHDVTFIRDTVHPDADGYTKNKKTAEFKYNTHQSLKGIVSPQSPFFPSPATTSSGSFLLPSMITGNDTGQAIELQSDLNKNGFANETLIGAETCQRCHKDIVAQWATSAHRFSSFNNPFYEATIIDMHNNSHLSNEWINEHIKYFPNNVGKTAKIKSKWCGACHDPAVMLTGKMTEDLNRRKPEAQAGLTCLACHAIDKTHDITGNGNYNIEDRYKDAYLFPDAESGTFAAFLHDALLKAKPEVHKRRMLKPFFKTSEYCATCHKVSLQRPVNNYRWLRGQNEFDNWHDSGVAMNASRTFYLPPFKRQCQDCHMPAEEVILGDLAAKDGTVKSHRFLGVNTALPYLRGDDETIRRIEQFLRNEKMRVDIFAIKSASSDRPIFAPDKNSVTLKAGDKIIVDVVVRNKGVGHTFPGGTNDSNEGWIEFSVMDENGNILAMSGFLDKKKHLDPMAHVYKALMVDSLSHPINKRNAQDIHSIVFANVIGPGTADIAHYEFTLPKNLSSEKLVLNARLLWRKFSREYTEFAFKTNPQGFKKFTQIPELPVTEIAASRLTLGISSAEHSIPVRNPENNEAEWIRYNDYGIGLFLENDTRAAILAFEQVEKMLPNSIEGPLNLAKSYIKEGSINKAYSYLKKCEQLKQGDLRVAWAWGLALQEDGLYEKAASAYRMVLEQFPEDRAAWRNLGRTYYLDQRYEEALKAYDQVLAIDPEDRISHYHRMLCLKVLGYEDEFLQAKIAYEFYKIDESAKKVTLKYRQSNPGANIMAQVVSLHKLVLSVE